MILAKYLINLLFAAVTVFFCVYAKSATINLAVGPDHQAMLANSYDVYSANWESLEQSLNDLGHQMTAHPMPWARAKAKVQAGALDGLFIAASFEERDQWALFTNPIGYEIYGYFENKHSKQAKEIYAAVRLGGQDRILSHIPPENLLYVPTAQRGLTLLSEDKVHRFIMSYGYGKYILENELNHISNITFNPEESEERSLHIAVSKQHPNSEEVVAILNQAIVHSVKKGYYHKAMKAHQVPERMQIKLAK